ncbi:hypothetical protein CEUSTIGMA_g6743.t1 [Chlamydomonas eustigma]|uniref:Uncharacterized protein n=1 Tax=Chlamydomonas eustigma TaxID=1157962 RepID=A0A250X8T5_9CHLO|nr:hypothetical protein CEUSTIGMA_g6743.t1 [Chlamydomonas eustigma]|eukprot:GAX79302.1 hypothetical protein CEUSTIGMA_g6743.t1 [Chlamydomonas eustigma]
MSLLDLIAQSAPTGPGIEVQQALRGAFASVLSSGSLTGGSTEESVHHDRYYRLDNGSWQQLLSAVHHPRRLPVLLLDPSQPRCVLAPSYTPSPPGALVRPPGAAASSGSRLHVAVCFMRCLVPCVPDFGAAAAAAAAGGVNSDKEGFLNLGECLRLEAVLCGRRRPLRMTQCDKRRLPESSNMDHPSRVEGMTAAAVPSTQANGVVGVKDSFESLAASVMLEVDVLGDDKNHESDDLCIDIIREVLSESHNGGLLRLNLWREGSDKHMPLLLSSEQLLLLPQGYEAAAAEISLAVKEAERARRSGAELMDDLGVVVEVACGDVAADLSTPCGTEMLGAVLSQEGLRLKRGVLEAVGSMEEAPGSKGVIEYFELPANPSQQRYSSCDIFQGDRISAQRLSDVAKVVELVMGDLFEWGLKTRRLATVELLRYCKSLLKQAKRERKALVAATQAVPYIEGRIQEFPMSSLPGRSLRSATENLHAQSYSNVVQKAVADDPVKAEAVRKFDHCISALNTDTSKGAVPAAVKKGSQGKRTPSEERRELPPQQNEGLKSSSEQLSQWAGQTMRSAASSSFWQTWSSMYIIMTFFLIIVVFLKNGPVALPVFLLWTAPYYPILICYHIHQRTASCTSSASPLLSALNSSTIACNDSKGCNGVCKEQLVCKTQAASKNVQLIRKGAQHSSAIHSDKDEAMPGVFTPAFTPAHAWVRGRIVWVISEDNLGMLLHMYRLIVIGLRAAYPSLLGTSKLVVISGKWYIIVAKCIMMMVESYDFRAMAAVTALLEVPVFYLAVRQSLKPAATVRQVLLVATITMLAQGAMTLRRRWQKLPRDIPVSALNGLLSRVLSESSVLGCNPASCTRGLWEKVQEEEQEEEEGINRGSQKKMTMPRKVSQLVKPQSYSVISPSLIPWLVFAVCTVVTCYAAVTISAGELNSVPLTYLTTAL